MSEVAMNDSQPWENGDHSADIQIRINININIPYPAALKVIKIGREDIGKQVWNRAQAVLNAAGITGKPVPLKILVPLLHYASLEEDVYLQERWAALLASTCADPNDVLCSFPTLLSQLSPQEARFLEALYFKLAARPEGCTLAPAPRAPLGGLWSDGRLVDFYRLYEQLLANDGIDPDGFQVQRAIVLDNLLRLQLLEMPMRGESLVGLTALGLALVTVCQSPTSNLDGTKQPARDN
jgi:hypothetical protein